MARPVIVDTIVNRFHLLGVLVATAVIAVLVLFGEAVVRVIDGYPLLHVTLPAAPARSAPVTVTSSETPDAKYFDTIPLAAGVDRAWYPRDPAPHTPVPMTPDIAARAGRYKDSDPVGAFFAWNPIYLKMQLCAGLRFGSLGILDDFYTFDSAGTQYPSYRHLSSISPPGWFRTNSFGWRGPDVALNKPPQTIRIAFAGSSMTVDGYNIPFSHIEYIGEWLNLWSQSRQAPFTVEVINIARTGVDSSSVAAAVLQELLPLEPDLVIFDGANDYRPGLLIDIPKHGLPPVPAGFAGIRPPWAAERYSAAARRLKVLLTRGEGMEPEKPSFPFVWPDGVNERNPDVTQRPLPMGLDTVMANFDAMRTAIQASGGQLALTSEVAMVEDGLKLQLPRDETLFTAINQATYPITYAQLRRAMDFQNVAYRNYALLHKLPFIDKTVLPLDPELFLDMVHMRPTGNRLQSWFLFQWLVRWIEQEAAVGRLPRAMQHPRNAHPAFPAGGYPLLSRAAIMATCQ